VLVRREWTIVSLHEPKQAVWTGPKPIPPLRIGYPSPARAEAPAPASLTRRLRFVDPHVASLPPIVGMVMGCCGGGRHAAPG
jgi:hypothetical protein